MRGEDGLNFVDKPLFRTPLFDASWRGHVNIVKDLLSLQASVNVADYQLRTPLHEAAYYGRLHIVEMLVDAKADLEAEDNWQQTPLFRAVDSGREDVVEYLVNHQHKHGHEKAKTNQLDSDGVTVQHLAAFNGNPEMSEWLFYQGAWKNRFAKEDGVTKPEAEEEKPEEKKEENPEAVQASPEASPQPSP